MLWAHTSQGQHLGGFQGPNTDSSERKMGRVRLPAGACLQHVGQGGGQQHCVAQGSAQFLRRGCLSGASNAHSCSQDETAAQSSSIQTAAGGAEVRLATTDLTEFIELPSALSPEPQTRLRSRMLDIGENMLVLPPLQGNAYPAKGITNRQCSSSAVS